MKLKVLLVHRQAVIPATHYGGTERVLRWLGQGLTFLKQEVYYWVHPNSSIDNIVAEVADDIDVVHFFEAPFGEFQKPWVYTQHGNAQVGESLPLNTIFISRNHAQRHGSKMFVHNGINPNEYKLGPKKRRQCCFLGKARWKVKNVKGAIEVAKKAEHALNILGGWGLSLNRKIKWRGMVNQELKEFYLRESEVLINPVRWHEPFGLAMVEAMLCGNAVLGTPYGSLPEIVIPEVGHLALSARELSDALEGIHFKPEQYREYAASHFDHIKMSKGYLRHYERVMAGLTVNEARPKLEAFTGPEDLLTWNEANA